GGGHAGCEACLASARMGHKTLLLTINLDTIAQMSCNPAIGGLAKGQLVKEIDALGGEMAKNIDATGIQFRILNMRKGPAVRSSRAQADKKDYQFSMKYVLENQKNLDIKQAMVDKLIVENKKVKGVITTTGMAYLGKSVIVTTGTFLKGLIHIGDLSYKSGRAGEPSAEGLSGNLIELGFEIGRLKTGTPPRINARSIDYSSLTIQYGDESPKPFSFSTDKITQSQLPCYLTYTTEKTHNIIRENLSRSAMYSGRIVGIGPRYCPSIEAKIVRFPDKEQHQIFLEPEGRRTQEVYVNGLSMSLPEDIQLQVLHSVIGLEKAEMMRPAYAIEYDFAPPLQIKPSLETKLIENLFFAGQINGTSGYEEAGAQGIMAGINAVLKIRNEEPFILSRSQAYIGVLIDDLVTKGTDEPYRMFTSQAEHRLILREDNADLRLMDFGRKFGLIDDETYSKFEKKRRQIEQEIDRLQNTRIIPDAGVRDKLKEIGTADTVNPFTLMDLLKRPEINYDDLEKLVASPDDLMDSVKEQVTIQVKYEGYIRREWSQIKQTQNLESWKIPQDLDYESIHGLSKEAREKLSRVRPFSLGQASRISGVSPADVSVLMIMLSQMKQRKEEALKESTTE
ncbi:MAG: tRNA uridine-5-carboxymethylaminomethyl(34) synthesis enzyme MnmG, partial [Candidatus Poribacteria bacterium]